MMKKVRWGIVCTGGIAAKFAQNILQGEKLSEIVSLSASLDFQKHMNRVRVLL